MIFNYQRMRRQNGCIKITCIYNKDMIQYFRIKAMNRTCKEEMKMKERISDNMEITYKRN